MNKAACLLTHRQTNHVGDSRQLIAQADARLAASRACISQGTTALESSLTALVEIPPELEKQALALVLEAATGRLWERISPATLEIIVRAVAMDLQYDAQLCEQIDRDT